MIAALLLAVAAIGAGPMPLTPDPSPQRGEGRMPPVVCPQLPPANECLRRSCEAWRWHDLFVRLGAAVAAQNEGAPCPEFEALADGCARDSWVWWHARMLQTPDADDALREAAQDRLIGLIGEDALRRGWLPPVPPFPERWAER